MKRTPENSHLIRAAGVIVSEMLAKYPERTKSFVLNRCGWAVLGFAVI